MTHAQALVHNTAGVQPSSCGGDLRLIETHPDTCQTREGMVERIVGIYRCDCGAIVTFAGDTLLNAYLPPRRIVGALAESLEPQEGRD